MTIIEWIPVESSEEDEERKQKAKANSNCLLMPTNGEETFCVSSSYAGYHCQSLGMLVFSMIGASRTLFRT